MKEFKGYILNGSLIKLEKHIDGEKVAECGIDSQQYFDLWGHEQPLRAEYELFTSTEGCPQYIISTAADLGLPEEIEE
jgi:hypothetical protein